MKATYTIEINAPIERAFDLVDDDEKIKLWMDGLEETTYTSDRDRENPVGTIFKQRIREGGRISEYEGEVTNYDKPNRLGVRIGNKHFVMRVDYRFTPTEAGTRLDYSAEMVQGNWIVRVVGKLFSWLTHRILKKQMKALKALAESGGVGSSSA